MEFSPLWHFSPLKILATSASMKGTEPPNFVRPTQQDHLALAVSSFHAAQNCIQIVNWCHQMVSPSLFLFSQEAQCCAACCLISEKPCLIYFVHFSSFSRENHHSVMRRSRRSRLFKKSFDKDHRHVKISHCKILRRNIA